MDSQNVRISSPRMCFAPEPNPKNRFSYSTDETEKFPITMSIFELKTNTDDRKSNPVKSPDTHSPVYQYSTSTVE